MPSTVEQILLPVERPPNEVLALIFKEAAESPLALRKIPVPLTVSRVCQRWRAVALSSAELWTTIRISERHRLNAATLFLERS
ncbi:hypothetical protein K438DRAFT_1591745, partial [Mycena galopus ATCC 62051]